MGSISSAKSRDLFDLGLNAVIVTVDLALVMPVRWSTASPSVFEGIVAVLMHARESLLGGGSAR
jgi:hypothetical protein